ncbi:MAG: caspase family protein [Limnospira sp.]
MSEFSKNLAVIIGINDYKNGISPLKTAVPDAKKVCEILRLQHEYQTWILLEDLATLESITSLIEETLPRQVSAGDRLILYFAGHGIALNGENGPEGYLIPQDAKLGNTDSYLPMTRLHSALSELPCRHFLGFLDCCFAGAFRWSSTRHIGTVPTVIHRERYDRFIADPAWQVIASAASDQKAADAFNFNTERGQKGDHSPFAAALIEALEGRADSYPPASNGKPPGDGIITATELYLYLRDAVEVPSENYRRQTPGLYPLKKHDKGEYIFLAPDHPLNLPPAPPLDISKNPYRGLETFAEKHSELFFGRTELTKKLFEFVNKNPLTVVLGASGSGKSSLVKAGLIPRLRKAESQDWYILPPIRPGEMPFQALNNALKMAQLPEFKGSSRGQDLVESISSWATTHPDSKLLLFIDQSEEIITLCKNEDERKAFFKQILAAINAHGGQFRVVLSLRSDFEPQVRDAGLKFLTADNQIGKTQLTKSWQKGRFIVPAMTRGELREAIEKPAEARVMYFQPHELVEQLIDEVADMPGALPLLSFALSELYLKYLQRQREAENRGETIDRSLTQEDYENLGGVIQSLTQRADDEYERLVQENPAYAKVIHHVMLRMVAVGGGELARRRVPLSELEYPPEKNDLVKTAIARFTEARLLVEGQDADGNPYVEPAHDALVRGWQKLLMWKQEDEENLLLQRRLTPAAWEWETQQKPRFLWNANPRLDLLKKVRKSDDNWLNKVEDEFVRRSVGRRSFNTRRNWGIAIAVMIGLGTGLVFSLIGQRNALIGQIRASRQAAEANFRSHQELEALMDSLQAGKTLEDWPWYLSVLGFNPENQLKKNVESTLRHIFYNSKESERLTLKNGIIRGIFFAGDRQLVSIVGQQNKVILFNKEGEKISELIGQDSLRRGHLSISSDGRKIVTATSDGKVRLWDLQGNKLAEFKAYQGVPKQYDSLIEEIKFVPDGNNIVTTGVDFTEENKIDKILRIWNLEGKKLKEIKIKGSKLGLWIGFNSQHELLIATLVEGNSGEIYVKVMDSSGQELARSENIFTTAVNVNFSPDG